MTVIAMQKDGILIPYTTSKGHKLALLRHGELSISQMFSAEHFDVRLETWKLRAAGIFILYASSICLAKLIKILCKYYSPRVFLLRWHYFYLPDWDYTFYQSFQFGFFFFSFQDPHFEKHGCWRYDFLNKFRYFCFRVFAYNCHSMVFIQTYVRSWISCGCN